MAPTSSAAPTVYTTPSEREIEMVRVVSAPARLVFAAWTSPEHLPHWLLGPDGWVMTVCEVDLRPGGAWRFVWHRGDDREMEMTGEYREIVPPERLVTTERWGGDWPETVNTLLLDERDGRTTITQRVLYPSREARDAALATGMKDGVDASFDRLDAYLATLD